MNPEIRFRVAEDIYAMAEARAQELGLAGPDAGKSAGVPLLARAALYEWLGLPWPADLPRPRDLSWPRVSLGQAGPAAAPAGGLWPDGAATEATLVVFHQIDDEYREKEALESHRDLPSSGRTVLRFPPAEVPAHIAPYLRPQLEGSLRGVLHAADLVSSSERLTPGELEAYLHSGRASPPVDLGSWRRSLRAWAEQNGSELLRARIEEGFEWVRLAEIEWASAQLSPLLGGSPLEELRDQQSLGESSAVHALLPEREPSLERIRLLRAMRSQAAVLQSARVRVSLVRGSSDRLPGRAARRASSPPFQALLWQLDMPSGNTIAFLSHQEPA